MIQILCRRAGSCQMELITPEALPAALADQNCVLWLDLCLNSERVQSTSEFLSHNFGFHPLAIEDALVDTHLSRVDDWQKYIYMSFHSLEYRANEIQQHELDLFLGSNYLITIHFAPIDPLQKLWDQLVKGVDPRQIQTADRLLYTLLDKITIGSMQVVDCLDDAMDELEQEIFIRPQRSHLPQLFRMRRAVLQLRRIFGSQREALNRLARDPLGVVHPESRVYFRDIYDHLVRMHELSDGLRDMASGALESHISVTSYRMNEVMKTLTVVTVLFMPLTFITGFFGMNFFADQYNIVNPVSPLLLFALCMLLMILTPIVMLYWMRQRGWLQSQLQSPDTGLEAEKEHSRKRD